MTNRTPGVPRTIVFAVSGTIFLNSTLGFGTGNLTIAGQTAPGGGICLANYPIDPSNSTNVIIRFLRSRLGDAASIENDAFNCRFATDLIVDHCSFSWSIDETASAYDNTRFTMQWCFVTESLRDSVHDKGLHGYGGIWGGLGATFHHNLIAHHDSRNPRLNGARYHGTNGELVDFRNNVIYNWRSNSTYGGEPTDAGIASRQNLINNYYKSGPATASTIRSRILNPSANANAPASSSFGLFHVAGNLTTASSSVTADNWAGGVQGPTSAQLAAMRATSPFTVAPVITQTAAGAYPLVLAYAGCRLPVRDPIDTRIASEVANGTVTYYGSKHGLPGIIDSQTDVGGWPVLASTAAPADGDQDGMPDAWETARGLNPANPNDRNTINGQGYTNLELYLNELAASAFPIPEISNHPSSQAVPFGTGFSLFVTASGLGPITYQWFRNGSAIAGATASSYSVASSSSGHAGTYEVVATNEYGGNRSNGATVQLLEQPPFITAEPASKSAVVGQTASLSATASGSTPLAYQWYKGDRILPGATNATLDLGPATLEKAGPYRVVASNAFGIAPSTTATFTVSSVQESGVFSTTFSSDTIHAASPVVTSTRSNWYVMSSKNASSTSIGDDPATSGTVDPRLDLTMAVTTSGVIDTAARFSAAPVSLSQAGQALRVRVTLSTTNVRALGIGLFNSGGVLPHTGMIESKLSSSFSDFATGGTRAWNGYRFHLDAEAESATISLEKRPTQPGTTNSSQSLVAPGTSSSAPTIQAVGTASVPGFLWTDGATYTLTFLVQRSATDTFSLSATVHAGTNVSAAALGSVVATTTQAPLVGSFDTLAVGYRNRNSGSISHVRITQVTVEQVTTTATVANPYQAYLVNRGLDPATNGLPGLDLEFDGLSNALEFILGGHPTTPDAASVLPTVVDESGWRFRFLRHLDTSSVFQLTIDGANDLENWHPLVNGVEGVTIVTTPFNATHEQVEVRLPDLSEMHWFLRLSAEPKP